MLTIAIVLFAVAALGGLVLASQALAGKTPPMAVAVIHGLFAASGLILLIMGVMKAATAGLGAWSLGIFLVAALGGFTLFSFHLRKRALPVPLVVVHALAAVTAFVMLLVWAL